ncbi:FtsX-like permease family protein [Paenibacillus pasadenensis]|uniref:ABC transporter permease n=1 Tax=Paenibacillus pasadenensis TaxID=217090 RepID=UPI00203FA02F|nr:FtsX-like permease family protein [Paenibacillus pasadenensis]MCM3746459.1 FtsX-like permease family protein [Paenibacillus pasadenensis]
MGLGRKTRRTILERKAQYFGTAALIALSCLLYTLFNQLSFNTDAGTAAFVTDYAQEDASFVTAAPLSGISGLEARFGLLIEQGESFDDTVSEGRTLRVFAEMSKVNKYAVIKGRPLSAENDLLLDPAYAKTNGISIGDTITIRGSSFTVAGFMSLPHYIYPLKKESDLLNAPGSFGIAVIGKDKYKSFETESHFYSVKVMGNAGTNADAKLEELKKHLKQQGTVILKWMNTDENPRVTLSTSKMDSMKTIGSIMPVAILLLTCVLTAVVMQRMLARESVIIGTLYAQGYRRGEITRHYLCYPLFVALGGAVAGTVLGLAALRPMLDYMTGYFNIPIASVSLSITHLAVSLLLPLGLLLVSVYAAIRRKLVHTPIELLRGGGEQRKTGFLERRAKLDRLKFAAKFKIREQLRSVPRSLFLLLGVALATMLLLLGFTMKSSIDYMLKDSYESTYKYRYEYMFNSMRQGAPPNGGETFSAAPFASGPGSPINFTAYGVISDTHSISLNNRNGKPIAFDRVVITKPLAERLNVKPDDTIKMVSKLDSRLYSIKVDEVADSYVGELLFMPLESFNELLGFPAESYLGVWSQQPLNIPDHELLSSSTAAEMRQAFDSLTQPMQAMLGVISLLSFMIGLIVIYVVTSLIIEENKDNISLMKVLGYRKKEVYSLILNSSAVTVVLGFLLGVPLLVFSLKAMYRSLADSAGIVMPVKMSVVYVGVGFVIIYLIFELSKAMSKKKIAAIPMAEALKSRAE